MAAEEIGSAGESTTGDIMMTRKVYIVTMVQPSEGAPGRAPAWTVLRASPAPFVVRRRRPRSRRRRRRGRWW